MGLGHHGLRLLVLGRAGQGRAGQGVVGLCFSLRFSYLASGLGFRSFWLQFVHVD